MKISIITVVRNGAEVLEQTIKSVLTQEYDDFEYIIIDGASTDGTLQVVDKYRNQLAQLVSEPDNGIYEAMNKGIKLCSGDIIGIINAGDYYFPGALQKVADTFHGKKLDEYIFWGDVEYSKIGAVRGWRPNNLKRGAFATHPSMFTPRAVYERIGLYDESYNLLGDYEFMYRAINIHEIKTLYLPELIAYYEEGGLSDRNIIACLRDELRVKQRYGASKISTNLMFWLKIIKNSPRIIRNQVR
ncbi:MAG: glycosyltransferase family 2 protein [Victivallaceae bacterium]|nr:glycosyltransferase family 2 protein [Victivallaceae bacterium]MDD4181369.1 glycosyltransferase family 2 protein [Victivallaceae bacterium]